LREPFSQFLPLILYSFVCFVNLVHFCYTEVNRTIAKFFSSSRRAKIGGVWRGKFLPAPSGAGSVSATLR